MEKMEKQSEWELLDELGTILTHLISYRECHCVDCGRVRNSELFAAKNLCVKLKSAMVQKVRDQNEQASHQ